MPPRSTQSVPFRKRRYEDITDGDDERATPSGSNNDTIGEQSISSPRSNVPNGEPQKPKPIFLVGIDFGTTMTSVSYYKFKLGKRPTTKISKEAIKSVIAWPNAASSQNRGEVPSESLYVNDEYYWGYGAQQKSQEVLSSDDLNDANRPIKFTKLFLEDSLTDKNHQGGSSIPCGPSDRSRANGVAPYGELSKTLEALNKSVKDVIRDYLVEILKHTKAHLAEYESFKGTSKVEFALSIPAGWPLKVSWALQEILKQAVEAVKFGHGFDLFLVNEPEAASAFALDMLVGAKMLVTGETFLVCDAGGGTVDVTTYTIKSRSPFRFSETVSPAGDKCGSVYVNQAMERHFRALLGENESLKQKKISAEEQLQHNILPVFETNLKRVFDTSKGLNGDESFVVYGLDADESKGFAKNRVKVNWCDVAGWFQYSLNQIADLIQRQIDASKHQEKAVKKIMLVGGFSQSPTLRHFLKKRFPSMRFFYHPDGEAETLVSRGAVYRAIDKSNGPSRHIMANIGILQIEEVINKLAAHRDAKERKRHPVNKRLYIPNCVNWVIKKGKAVGFEEHFTERLYQVIEEDEDWEFSQRLYYSVTDNVQDHYQLYHPNNKGYEEAGMISVDLTRWKEEYPIPLKGRKGRKYYEIQYDVRMELQGRNLKVSLVYPPGQEVQSSLEICIAASFVPGTE
ncbi:hypothetical protein N7507_011646 [Penicillium longicatenatum]|nr:hypothetical protein N7507_011646 [Penicillium longicatenatum]